MQNSILIITEGVNLDNIKSFYVLVIMQYLKEAGWADGGRVIACTQPRRLAVQVFCPFSPTSFFFFDK